MILVISKSQRASRSITEMLYFMGIPSYTATPPTALSEISPIYSAIILVSPESLADKRDYSQRLRSYADIPIFALTEKESYEDKFIFDGVINGNHYASKILKRIVEFCELNGRKAPGIYKLAGIDASIDVNLPTYFEKPIQLTKTESMILRTLISIYPVHTDSESILKYAFRQTKLPEKSNVRTHISIINKKFREVTGRNIISSTPSVGYRILTPEIIEALI